jgi:hypothetical protein
MKKPRENLRALLFVVCFVDYFANTYLTPKVTEDKLTPNL